MESFESTRDAASQLIVAATLVGVFALPAADRVLRGNGFTLPPRG